MIETTPSTDPVANRPTAPALPPVRARRARRDPDLVEVPRWRGVLAFWVSAVAVLGIWELASDRGWVETVIVPPPSAIWDSIFLIVTNLFSGIEYGQHFWITLQEIFIGFVIATAIGLVLGAFVEEFILVRSVVEPYTVALNAAPKIAFAPLFVVWFGFGMSSKVYLAAFIAFFPVYVNTVAGLRSVDREQLELMRSLSSSRLQTFAFLKVRKALPFIFAGAKTAMALAVIGAVVAEFSGATVGAGYLIKFTAARLRTDELFALILLLSVLGFVLFRLIEVIERRVVFWSGENQERMAARAR